jgi:hypothetical protein
MLRTTFATTVALALATALLGGCGKTSPTVPSYDRLNKVASQTTTTQPIAQGTTDTTAIAPAAKAATGALLLSISSLKDASGTIDSVDVTLTGAGLAQPLNKRLTAADLQSSNTLDFEHIPSGVLTATLKALDKSGTSLGTKTANVTVAATGQSKTLFVLKASPFDFTVTDPTAVTASPAPADSTGTETPVSTGTTGTTTTADTSSDSALGVEVVSKATVRKYLLFKRLSVTLRVTNHNTTGTLNGQVTLNFHHTSGIFSKTDAVVETLTAPVTSLAPGKSVEITLQSTKSAEDAEATVHTVLASSTASTASL